MDGSQQSSSGFSSHVQEQLLQAARSVGHSQPDRGRGQYRRARGHHHPNNQLHHHTPLGNYQHAPQRSQGPHPQPWGNQSVANPRDMNSFPPLGVTHSQPPEPYQQSNQPVYTQSQPLQPPQHTSNPSDHPVPSANQSPQYQRREPFFRGRGHAYRGRGNYNSHNNQYQSSPQGQYRTQKADDFQRPQPFQRKLFTSDTHSHFNSAEEQRAVHRRIMDQSDFLNFLASQSLKNQLTMEEQQAKESFRKELETIAQRVITEARTDTMKFDPSHVRLKLYGSLGSGFGVAGSDMDLLLAIPQNEGSLGDIEIESRRMLEKGLLDAGIGARLLTNTRVPILRVCEKPNPELLKNLRECRLSWENSLTDPEPPPADEGFGPLPFLTESQIVAAAAALADLDISACEVPLPTSPPPEHAKLEFVGNCGIQCDINFTNYVALHNTSLLKTYGKCDSRVRQVGVFVKSWAKARDINTPYRGTLSSYGYILMVLHYLMSVVSPPVIPNLQEIAKHRDSFKDHADVELVEGFDVRFVHDMDDVQLIMKDMPRNHESVGSLLRGFFQYYADTKGFHWQQDVISIRSRSGRLTKRSKGWTEAKWAESNQNVRLRYLLAIEDPFELEHNVGRTVGHSGIVAIRDEFRRAWSIVDKIKFDSKDRAWFWLTQDDRRIDGADLMSIVENRGDLLRKDQDYNRQKARQMRQELEAKEKALQMAAAQEDGSVEETGLNGTFELKTHNIAQESQILSTSASPALVNDGNSQIKRRRQKTSNRRAIQDDEEEDWQATQTIKVPEIDWSKPFGETEISIHPEWASSLANENTLDQEMPQQSQSTQFEVQQDWNRLGMSGNGQPFEEEPRTTMSELEDDQNKPDQSSNVRYAQKEPEQELVEVIIAWNGRSKAGRWLRWRDKQIREGTWQGPQEEFQRLDNEFPYDPNMTVMDLAMKNKILTTSYMNSYHPKDRSAQRRRLSEGGQFKSSESNTMAPDQDHVSLASTKTSQNVQAETPTWTNDTKSEVTGKSRSEQPRRRSQRTTSGPLYPGSETTTHISNASTTNVRQPRPSQPQFGPAQPRARNKKRGSERSEHVETSQNLAWSELSTTTRSQTSAFVVPSQSGPPTTQMPQLPASPDPLLPISKHPPLVPLTLHPEVAAHHRPRDEDPDIMPIPRKLNFRFDPRQLADLEVISRGGNGCARAGEEFEIEIDYEFGGGGAMAAKSSSGAYGASRKWDQSEKIGSKWEARGDEEGLLGELPRNVDV